LDVGDAGRLSAVVALNEHHVGAGAKRRRWPWIFGAGVGALVASALRTLEPDAVAGTQQCNTECQSKMTDCILACDGMRSCEEACKKKGQSCVSVCSSDAGPPPDPDDGGIDGPSDVEISDARTRTTKDGPARRAARDR
jgi:hypothetical protein